MAVVAVVAAVAAFWVTIDAKFLEHRYWLAVQKADFILGPVLVGLYWRRRRPASRMGLWLIALGLLAIPYILESTTVSSLFTLGVMTEFVLYPMIVAVILAFPNGRLDGRVERLIVGGMVLAATLPGVFWLLVSPQEFGPSFSISGCRALCPADPLAPWSTPSWYGATVDYARATQSALWLATAALLAWRFMTGTRPRRRALAIGAPIAMCYLLISAAYQTVQLINPNYEGVTAPPLNGPFQWTIAASTSAVWYGFLFALIAAELFAGRTLRRLVGDSLGRPSLHEIEGMVRGPLGDPGLRLGFWRPAARAWVDGDGAVLEAPGPGEVLTEVKHEERSAVAIVHDSQLSENPELLQTAGSVALLALENAELDSAWKESVRQLADSQARLVRAGDSERRKLERDLHDGAQQRLMAVQIKLRMAKGHADAEIAEELGDIEADATQAVEELRALAHGIYPAVLRDGGVSEALRSMAMSAPVSITVQDEGIERLEGSVEAAIYYCCLEAVQNAVKHAGRNAQVSTRLYTDDDELHVEIRDDGPGFDTARAHDGIGLQNMRDRLGAVGGRIEISSHPGQGTLVAATIRLTQLSPANSPTGSQDGQSTRRRTARSVPSG